jgi:UDP-N-acetylmuramoyl-L-alanyl-D-glutamate--2,6-diaminopimelate ligase
MKLLKDLLYKARIEEVVGSTNVAIDAIAFDSRKVGAFSAFVAVVGTLADGHDYIDRAVDKGAVAVICEQLPEVQRTGVSYVRVKSSSEALAHMACNFYNHPSSKLKLIGVTGTNGKTSVVTLLHALFTGLGYKAGMLSTVVNKIGREELASTHTTPDALSVNKLLARMVDEGCDYCFMEASSHAIHQHRVTGLDFNVGVFTNITRDHLDYHKTFDNYIAAKKGLFDMLGAQAYALVNKDDNHAEIMVQNSAAKTKTFSVRELADYKAKIIENRFSGLQLNINGNDVWTKLVGKFNAYNLLAVFGVADLMGQDKLAVLTELSNLNTVEGRFQYLRTKDNISGIVDYAHTPDALENVLKTIKDIRTGNEQVITVVGCGGDRDAGKRPEMARIACEFSTKVILTSDNPRTEDPQTIIDDMQEGVPPQHFKKTMQVVSRKEAIKAAILAAEPGDILLIAGKGHEKYQEINGVRHDFDDMAIMKELFEKLNA